VAGRANVAFQCRDITDLSHLADASVDAVISCMSLHHLPTWDHLKRTLDEVARVVKAEGGIYIADFGRLRSQRSMRRFAFDHVDRQHPRFTEDYMNSLRAAFTREDFARACEQLGSRAILHATGCVPFMLALKTPPRHDLPTDLASRFRRSAGDLDAAQHSDLQAIIRAFRAGGLKTAAFR